MTWLAVVLNVVQLNTLWGDTSYMPADSQIYRPNPSLPQELNEWLSQVQEHKGDFRLIRESAGEEPKSLFHLNDDYNDDESYKKDFDINIRNPNRKRGSSEDKPQNDIYPHMFKNRQSNVSPTSQKPLLNKKSLSSKNVKSPVRLRRSSNDAPFFENHYSINVQPAGKSGEIKRSDSKYPDSYNRKEENISGNKIDGESNIERENFDEKIKEDKKRELQIDIKNDGRLVKQIREDTKSPKSIVLNIQSPDVPKDPLMNPKIFEPSINLDNFANKGFQQNPQELTNKIKNTPDLSIPSEYNQLKNKELANNFNNLFTVNEHLNTDNSLAHQSSTPSHLIQHVALPGINSAFTSPYVPQFHNYDTPGVVQNKNNYVNNQQPPHPYSFNNNMRDMSSFWSNMEKSQMQKGLDRARINKNYLAQNVKSVPVRQGSKVKESATGFEPAQRIELDNDEEKGGAININGLGTRSDSSNSNNFNCLSCTSNSNNPNCASCFNNLNNMNGMNNFNSLKEVNLNNVNNMNSLPGVKFINGLNTSSNLASVNSGGLKSLNYELNINQPDTSKLTGENFTSSQNMQRVQSKRQLEVPINLELISNNDEERQTVNFDNLTDNTNLNLYTTQYAKRAEPKYHKTLFEKVYPLEKDNPTDIDLTGNADVGENIESNNLDQPANEINPDVGDESLNNEDISNLDTVGENESLAEANESEMLNPGNEGIESIENEVPDNSVEVGPLISDGIAPGKHHHKNKLVKTITRKLNKNEKNYNEVTEIETITEIEYPLVEKEETLNDIEEEGEREAAIECEKEKEKELAEKKCEHEHHPQEIAHHPILPEKEVIMDLGSCGEPEEKNEEIHHEGEPFLQAEHAGHHSNAEHHHHHLGNEEMNHNHHEGENENKIFEDTHVCLQPETVEEKLHEEENLNSCEEPQMEIAEAHVPHHEIHNEHGEESLIEHHHEHENSHHLHHPHDSPHHLTDAEGVHHEGNHLGDESLHLTNEEVVHHEENHLGDESLHQHPQSRRKVRPHYLPNIILTKNRPYKYNNKKYPSANKLKFVKTHDKGRPSPTETVIRKRDESNKYHPRKKYRRRHQKETIFIEESDPQKYENGLNGDGEDSNFVTSKGSNDLIPAFVGRQLKAVDYIYDPYLQIPEEDIDDVIDTKLKKFATEKNSILPKSNAHNNVSPKPNFQVGLHKNSAEGDYGEEEDSATESHKNNAYTMIKKTNNELADPRTTTEGEDYENYDYDDISYIKREKPKPKHHKKHKKKGRKKPRQRNIDNRPIELKGHDMKGFAHHRQKSKPKIQVKKQRRSTFDDVPQLQQPNINKYYSRRFVDSKTDFQHWPDFVVNDHENEENLRKRSAVVNKKYPRAFNFPLSSNNFFVKPPKSSPVKREKQNSLMDEEPTKSSQDEVENFLGSTEKLSTSTAVDTATSFDELDDACDTKTITNVCEDKADFNKSTVEITTILSMGNAVGDSSSEGQDACDNNLAEIENKTLEKLDDILNGKLPFKLVSTIMERLKENSKLKKRFHKTPTGPNKNFLKGLNETNSETQRLVESMTNIMNKLQYTATCQSLPHGLRHYLKIITRGSKFDALAKTKEMEEIEFDDNQNQNNFIFQSSSQGDNFQGKVKVLQDLLDRFNKLPERCKARAMPVKEYIENHLGMLNNMLSTANKDSSNGGKPKKSIENTSEESDSFKSEDDLIEEQLESLGLGKRQQFKPGFDLDQMVENNKFRKASSSSQNKATERSRSVKVNKRDLQTVSRSKKYDKLVDAVRRLRMRREGQKRLGKMYGRPAREDYEDLDFNLKGGEEGANFESPLVYSL